MELDLQALFDLNTPERDLSRTNWRRWAGVRLLLSQGWICHVSNRLSYLRGFFVPMKAHEGLILSLMCCYLLIGSTGSSRLELIGWRSRTTPSALFTKKRWRNLKAKNGQILTTNMLLYSRCWVRPVKSPQRARGFPFGSTILCKD